MKLAQVVNKMMRNDLSIYERHAGSWWDTPKAFQRLLASQVHPRMAYFSSISPGWKDQTVLDLGCGGGFMSEAMARQGALVIGLDPCIPLLEVARKHALISGLHIDYRAGYGESIPLPAQSVDRVVCVDVLEHVEEVPHVLREIRRVLKPGGIFFFDTINRTWLAKHLVINMAENLLRIIPRGTHDPRKFIRPEEMRRYLLSSGFSHIAKRFTGMGPDRLNRHLDFEVGLLPFTHVLYLGWAR